MPHKEVLQHLNKIRIRWQRNIFKLYITLIISDTFIQQSNYLHIFVFDKERLNNL